MLAKLVQTTPITMVYGRYIISILIMVYHLAVVHGTFLVLWLIHVPWSTYMVSGGNPSFFGEDKHGILSITEGFFIDNWYIEPYESWLSPLLN